MISAIKAFLITILTSLLFFQANAQKACKYEKDEIDAITELKVRITQQIQLCKVNNAPFLIKAQSIGDRRYLKIRYYRYDNFSILPNTDFTFTFSDNTTLEVTPRETKTDTANTDNSFTAISSMIILPLSEQQFYKLLHFPVTKMKYYIPGGYEFKDIKESKQEDLKQILSCIED